MEEMASFSEIIQVKLKLRMMNNAKTAAYIPWLSSFPKVLCNECIRVKCKSRGCDVLSIYLIKLF